MFEPPRHANKSWDHWRMRELKRPADMRAERAAHQAAVDAQLTALQHEVGEQAHKEGYQAGFAEGRKAGYEQGLKQGLEEGRRQGEQAFVQRRNELTQPLTTLLKSLQQAIEQVDTTMSDHLVDVALAAARKLADDAISAKPAQVLTLIRNLLHAEPLFQNQARLHLHPQDAQLVDPELAQELASAGWALQPDADVARGGCRITGSEGELDATRDARWEALLSHARRYGSSPVRRPANKAKAEAGSKPATTSTKAAKATSRTSRGRKS